MVSPSAVFALHLEFIALASSGQHAQHSAQVDGASAALDSSATPFSSFVSLFNTWLWLLCLRGGKFVFCPADIKAAYLLASLEGCGLQSEGIMRETRRLALQHHTEP